LLSFGLPPSVSQPQSAADSDSNPSELISVKICYFIEPIDLKVALIFIQDCWTLTIIWYTKEYGVSETGSVSVVRLGEEDTYSVGPVRKS
jgi:hypothetical protein